VLEALGCAPADFTLASLRYDLSKLRAKGLIAKVPRSRRYQLLPQGGCSICLLFLKLFERIYAPLAAGLLNPSEADTKLPRPRGTRGFACDAASPAPQSTGTLWSICSAGKSPRLESLRP
jgi:hypothetical protein